MRINFLIVTITITLFSIPTQAADEVYFRYTNINGVTVIDDFIPAKYAGKGYSIINKDGVVIEIIPPALTLAEIAEKERQEKTQKQLAEQARQQENSDRHLLSTFASTEEIALTRDRVVAQLQIKLTSLERNRADQKKQLDKLRDDAANMERSLGNVSDTIQDGIKDRKQKLVELDKLIAINAGRVETARKEYQGKIERYNTITGS
ncbi:MAG: hypothetical protein KUG72_01585 [Pseudomonadales bacterium]|nr:hypothetical protein [Pseudomonadales bacterium]